MNQKKILYLTIVFWLLVFSGFIAFKEYTLRTGKEVILKTEPVDPRDIFRGDYVNLNYNISTLDLKSIPADSSYFEYNDKIYLALEVKDGYGVPKKIYMAPPENELYIKGNVINILHDWDITESDTMIGIIDEGENISTLMVNYGIESYFVPEGKGLELERNQWTGKEKVDVKVVIDKFGNAVIKSLLIDGKEVEF